MPDAAVITAIYGGYDDVKPALPQEGMDVEWVLVTDDPAFGGHESGWRVVHEPRPGMHPNRAAKGPKLRPWAYTDAPASVWVDGSVRVTSPRFAVEALAYTDPVGQFAHPERDCIYDEALLSERIPKYAAEPVVKQAEHYRALGHPPHWGLWATTVIARRHTPVVKDSGEAWAAEITRWSFQDQISQPYVLRTLGLRPAVLPGYYRINDWLRVEGSAKHQ